jgi:hypothetical protein
MDRVHKLSDPVAYRRHTYYYYYFGRICYLNVHFTYVNFVIHTL